MTLTKRQALQEWRYWNITRHTRDFIPWVARNLPNRVKYWVVIHGMVKVAGLHRHPTSPTGMELLDFFADGKEGL